MDKKIIRVFARQTNATPLDEDVRIRQLPNLWDEADEVHISITFSWDLAWGEYAAKQWACVAPTKLGGPAFELPGKEFIPGLYLREGYVITSRGCTNHCWFCAVPKRERGVVRELEIKDGWIITDDNLLACSKEHISKVFEMLKRQSKRPIFTGGLEAKLLTQSIAEKLKEIKPARMYFAYDTADDYEPLVEAGKILKRAGLKKTQQYCYVLVGYKGDTEAKAYDRIKQAWEAGFTPMAMLYRDYSGQAPSSWKKFQRQWANPVIRAINCKLLDNKRE